MTFLSIFFDFFSNLEKKKVESDIATQKSLNLS